MSQKVVGAGPVLWIDSPFVLSMRYSTPFDHARLMLWQFWRSAFVSRSSMSPIGAGHPYPMGYMKGMSASTGVVLSLLESMPSGMTIGWLLSMRVRVNERESHFGDCCLVKDQDDVPCDGRAFSADAHGLPVMMVTTMGFEPIFECFAW